jgi:starvation-inducible DNA-binding protein
MTNATANRPTATSTTVIAGLHRQQANAMVLYQNIKKYHWNTYGPLFRDIHLLFDDQATFVIATVDDFAERALMIDGRPLSDPADYLKTATVKPSVGDLSLDAMVAEAVAGHDVVIGEMHADAEDATQAGDIGTADLYTRLVQSYQKQRWFLKELLKKNDGLVS